jgi:hypothetical protein
MASIGPGNQLTKWAAEDQLRKENKMREESHKLQKRLVEQQIEMMRQKNEAIRRGDALIKIEADGLEPEIEAFMWKILEKIQIRAAEAEAEFLLGIAS